MNKQSIEELLKKISPWPWHWDEISYVWRNDQNGLVCDELVHNKEEENSVCRMRGIGSKEPLMANAEFIAQAPEIISSLLQELDQYRWRELNENESIIIEEKKLKRGTDYTTTMIGCQLYYCLLPPLPSPNKEGV